MPVNAKIEQKVGGQRVVCIKFLKTYNEIVGREFVHKLYSTPSKSQNLK